MSELALGSASPLFRRAVAEIGHEEARGFGPRGFSPDLAAQKPLGPKPRALGSRLLGGWIKL